MLRLRLYIRTFKSRTHNTFLSHHAHYPASCDDRAIMRAGCKKRKRLSNALSWLYRNHNISHYDTFYQILPSKAEIKIIIELTQLYRPGYLLIRLIRSVSGKIVRLCGGAPNSGPLRLTDILKSSQVTFFYLPPQARCTQLRTVS